MYNTMSKLVTNINTYRLQPCTIKHQVAPPPNCSWSNLHCFGYWSIDLKKIPFDCLQRYSLITIVQLYVDTGDLFDLKKKNNKYN